MKTASSRASPGKAVIDCATLEPSDMERLDALVTGAGGRFAEAPVSGSKVPAEQALIFMVAGDETLQGGGGGARRDGKGVGLLRRGARRRR